jgi:hypothetical protein
MPAMQAVRAELEQVLLESAFFENAPFEWIGLIIRYGLKDEFDPEYQKVDKVHGDLPIAIEVDSNRLIKADIEAVKAVFRRATSDALIHVAKKYGLPGESIKAYRERLPSF